MQHLAQYFVTEFRDNVKSMELFPLGNNRSPKNTVLIGLLLRVVTCKETADTCDRPLSDCRVKVP